MKVAIIEPVGGHGGMHYYDFGLASGLQEAGVDVTLYTCEETALPTDAPYVVRHGFRNIWGNSPRVLRAMRFLFSLLKIYRELKNKRIRIAHFHFFHFTLLEEATILLARLFRLKAVVTVHDVESFSGEGSQQRARRILSRVQAVIVHNQVSKSELVQQVNIPAQVITIIPHGNYLKMTGEGPSRQQARQQLGLAGTGPVLLFFGQVKKVKGLDLLLRALPLVREHFPDIRLVVAGKTWKDDFTFYDRLIRENGLEKTVIRHIRFIPDDEVARYYRAADLLVLPYRKIYQSGVLLLAMSYQVPVLAADLEGMREIVRDGENGFLFRSEDVGDLARQMVRALSDPSRLENIAAAGYTTVQREHDWNDIGNETNRVYHRICP